MDEENVVVVVVFLLSPVCCGQGNMRQQFFDLFLSLQTELTRWNPTARKVPTSIALLPVSTGRGGVLIDLCLPPTPSLRSSLTALSPTKRLDLFTPLPREWR